MNGGDYIPRTDRFDLKLAKRFGPPGSENEFSITALSVKGSYPDFHGGKFRHQPRLFASLQIGW
jgi:iron complex outermembrane receptor protein